MKEMGWSYRDLLDAPTDLVEEIAEKIAATNRYTAKRQEMDEAKRRNTHS